MHAESHGKILTALVRDCAAGPQLVKVQEHATAGAVHVLGCLVLLQALPAERTTPRLSTVLFCLYMAPIVLGIGQE